MSPKKCVPRFCGAAGLPAALVLGILLGAWSSPVVFPPSPVSAPFLGSAAPAAPQLSVAPTSWWMVAGNSTAFVATWSGIPPGCTNTPVSFRWSVLAGWAEGALGPLDTSITHFTAYGASSGVARVEVRSATVVHCGTGESADVQRATANVTVVVPPQLGPLAFDTDPAPVGSTVNLTGSLIDGTPPYRVRVTWGDGAFSELYFTSPGAFTIPHRFPEGTFAPTISVVDSIGLTTNGSVVEPEYSSSNFAVGIESARYSTEVGASVAFRGRILDPPSLYSEATSCSDARPVAAAGFRSGPTPSGPTENFSCAFASPGSAEITFEVVPSGGTPPPATATLSLPVRSSLGLGVHLPDPSTEVGQPAIVAVEVSGGVPPFHVQWGLEGDANGSHTTLSTDGTLLVPVDPAVSGSFGVSVVVEDALGFEVRNSSAQLAVDGALNVSVTVSCSIRAAGPTVLLTGTVTQGVAPFLWFVVPGLPPANSSTPEGNLSVVSGFEWTGTLPYEGNSSITVGVIDSGGAFWWTDRPLKLVAPLEVSGQLTVVPGDPSPSLVLNLTLEGGLPPFALWANSTSRPEGNASAPLDGSYSWSWPTNGTGNVREEIVVVDRLGVRWSENATVHFPTVAPGSPPSDSPPPTVPSPPAASAAGTGGAAVTAEVGGIVTLVLVAVGGFAWYRRRRGRARTPPPPAPEPVTVLRRIIEPADGIDRATVELLAEEAGVSLPTTRATLERLVSEGRLRSETGADGEEVYAWSPREVS